MISEEEQEKAVLYSLGLLDADEAAMFESEMSRDEELRAFTAECHEASASLALADYPLPEGLPARLKEQIIGGLPGIPQEGQLAPARQEKSVEYPKIIRPARFAVVPWAIAALLTLFCGLLFWQQGKLQEERSMLRTSLDQVRAVRVPARELLGGVAFCQMEIPGVDPMVQPRAAVVWDAVRQEGVLQIVRLKPPATGQDYELWAVEDGRKEPVSAGLVHLDDQGKATTSFKPTNAEGGRVLAFALSLEKAGGSPVNVGPIILVGNL